MNCKEIAENYALASEIVRIEERGKTRLFIIICILGFALILESAYIIYDRKKDSEFMIESTEIVQDGQGNNTYIDGVGVFHGAESQENEK